MFFISRKIVIFKNIFIIYILKRHVTYFTTTDNKIVLTCAANSIASYWCQKKKYLFDKFEDKWWYLLNKSTFQLHWQYKQQQHINHLSLHLWETKAMHYQFRWVLKQTNLLNHFRLQMSSESIISPLNLKSSSQLGLSSVNK